MCVRGRTHNVAHSFRCVRLAGNSFTLFYSVAKHGGSFVQSVFTYILKTIHKLHTVQSDTRLCIYLKLATRRMYERIGSPQVVDVTPTCEASAHSENPKHSPGPKINIISKVLQLILNMYTFRIDGVK